jgi:hypothetical protein
MRAAASGKGSLGEPYVRDDLAVGVVVEVKKVTRPIPKDAWPPFAQCAEFPELVQETGESFEACFAAKDGGCLELGQVGAPIRARGWPGGSSLAAQRTYRSAASTAGRA